MKHLIFVLSILSLGLTGCAGTPVGGRDYHTHQVRSVGSVQEGVVLAIRPVVIHEAPGAFGGSNYLGSTIGAALGGLLGAQVTNGNARYVAGTVGAALGATLGSHAGTYVAKQSGIELDSGSQLASASSLPKARMSRSRLDSACASPRWVGCIA